MDKPKLKNLAEEDLQAISNVMGGLLDKQAATLAGKEDLHKVELRLGLVETSMATKEGLKVLESSLKDYIHQDTEAVIQGMDNLSGRFVEKEKLEKLLEWAR